MRAYDQGSCYRVYVSIRDIENFNKQCPCSHLRIPVYFVFDKRNGDLIDTDVSRYADGGEALALSQDAQEYGAIELGIETARVYDYQGNLSIYT